MAPHEFDRRLAQALAALPELSKGHRERLVRPLRQLDLDCQPAPADPSLDAALRAAVRTLAHELLETLLVQLEAALAACRSDAGRVLVAALAALGAARGARVAYRLDGAEHGCQFPGVETLAIELAAPRAGEAERLRLHWRDDERPEARAAHWVVVPAVAASPSYAAWTGKAVFSVDAALPGSHAEPTDVVGAAEVADDPFRVARRLLEALGVYG